MEYALPATFAPTRRTGRPVDRGPLSVSLALTTIGSLTLATTVSSRHALLFLVGVGAGLALYHAAFGFTSAWRVLIAHGRGSGVRAQMLMLAVTTTVFVPLIAHGSFWGQAIRGSVAPAGVPVIVGAFVFGVGMQLGGGCASGTLYSAGGGSVRMLATLGAFVVGSVLGVRYSSIWDHAPALRPMSLVGELGSVPALVLSLAGFGLVAVVALAVERRGRVALDRDPAAERWHALHGPWTLAAGAIGLAAVNIATLLIAGRPWGVTAAFALWGSKALMTLGIDVASWPYWQVPARAGDLHASVLRDVTSVMDIGIMLGALAAAALAGRFSPVWRVPLRSLVAAIIGGLLLGYGARIAFGCNIGAFFSGISSTSLHGWVWFVAAFAGSTLGTRLRPWFGLSV